MSQTLDKAIHSDDGNPALLDTATGALSRTAFILRLEEAAALAARLGHGLALVCLDLREPKALCAAHGPHAVDAILAQAVDRLWDRARHSDTVARIAPARLAVLLPATDQVGAELYASRLLPALRAPYRLDGAAVQAGFDISVTGVSSAEAASRLLAGEA